MAPDWRRSLPWLQRQARCECVAGRQVVHRGRGLQVRVIVILVGAVAYSGLNVQASDDEQIICATCC
jgi:hypothetical protein